MEAILKKFSETAERILVKFKEGLASLRSGRPNPALIEDVLVEYYGSKLPLKQVASISSQPPNLLLVESWDKAALEAIEKALYVANVGAAPVAEGKVLRLAFPPLTEERRKEMAKQLREKAEAARIQFRQARDEARKAVQTAFDAKNLSEDEKFRAQEELQKRADDFNAKLETLVKQKEEEVMKV